MGESERNWRKSGRAESFPQKEILLMKEMPFYSACLGALIANPSYKIPKKNQKEKLLQGTKREENQKVTKESQNVKGKMNSGTGKAISRHGAKFSASAPSFLLILICNVEFDSNSSCLDRLDNIGINSLQKLQN